LKFLPLLWNLFGMFSIERYNQLTMHPFKNKKITIMLWLVFMFAGLMMLSRQTAKASTSVNQSTGLPTASETPYFLDHEGTPALLLTPLRTLPGGEGGVPAGSLAATGLLMICTMAAMLVAGFGFAILMVRLRTRMNR
jgi:hypothetical protein